MSQHDMNIANDIAPLVRADINNALAALVSQNSGSSAPSTTYANMIWYDTTNNILKMRNEANDAWISMFYFDQAADALRVLQNTLVTNTSGTQIGILGQQTEGTWIGGSSTTESLVSPAKIKTANVAVGVDQTWQYVGGTRTTNVSYQNTTGRAIQVSVTWTAGNTAELSVSDDNSTYVNVSYAASTSGAYTATAIVPRNHYYKLVSTGGTTINYWAELR